MEGSLSRCEPSTLKTHIVDGSIEYSRTFHANPPFHGRFSFQVRTFHAEDPYRGWFNRKQPNLPRQYPFSWKVQFPGANLPRRRPISWTVHASEANLHARGRYHGRFASLKSAYYTWQRKCLRTKHCQSLTGNIQYSEKLRGKSQARGEPYGELPAALDL